MLNLKSVHPRNFKSFGNKEADIPLNVEGSKLIIGNNQDIGEQGQSRNGVGKTTIMSAVVFALYGKDIEKAVKADEMINFKNRKEMSVRLEFEIKGKDYTIVRGRSPNKLTFHVDGKSLTRDSMKNTDQLIADTIQIDYDLFMSIFFLNTFRPCFRLASF